MNTPIWEEIKLHQDDNDDPGFIRKATSIINGSLRACPTDEVYLVHINNWFDWKWLDFRGKVMGTLGQWDANNNQHIPPFVPNRVLSQQYFKLNRDTGVYEAIGTGEPLHAHLDLPSVYNRFRQVRQISDSCTFAWYSGNTTHHEHGSLMVYISLRGETQSWYASFTKAGEWIFRHEQNISRVMLAELEQSWAH